MIVLTGLAEESNQSIFVGIIKSWISDLLVGAGPVKSAP